MYIYSHSPVLLLDVTSRSLTSEPEFKMSFLLSFLSQRTDFVTLFYY